MKILKGLFLLAFLSVLSTSCSNEPEEKESSAFTLKSSASGKYLTAGDAEYFFDGNGKFSKYVKGVYSHDLYATVNMTVEDMGDHVLIKSPVAGEYIKLGNIDKQGGLVKFDAFLGDKDGNTTQIDDLVIDEGSFDQVLQPSWCWQCVTIIVVAIIDATQNSFTDNCVAATAQLSSDCVAAGGLPNLVMEEGFFSNTCEFNCVK